MLDHRPNFKLFPHLAQPLLICAVLALTACKSTPLPPAIDDPDLAHVVPSRTFTDATALTTEFQLLSSPHDLKSRVDLLWHYRVKFGDAQAEREANKHILWLITNQPRAAVLATPIAEISTLPNSAAFDSARAMWLGQVEAHPEDSRILGNAGVFLLREDPTRAMPLLDSANKIDPNNTTWLKALAEGYRAQAMATEGQQRQLLAELSVSMYERAADRVRSVRERMAIFSRAATIARHLDDGCTKALSLSGKASALTSAVDSTSDRAVVAHTSAVIAGLCAISSNRIDFARDSSIVAAGETLKNQSVSLTDLDMSLAQALLDRGEKNAVLIYLDLCANATQSSEVRAWIEKINRGEKPDFSGYLH